jgi:hypothetical protein
MDTPVIETQRLILRPLALSMRRRSSATSTTGTSSGISLPSSPGRIRMTVRKPSSGFNWKKSPQARKSIIGF